MPGRNLAGNSYLCPSVHAIFYTSPEMLQVLQSQPLEEMQDAILVKSQDMSGPGCMLAVMLTNDHPFDPTDNPVPETDDNQIVEEHMQSKYAEWVCYINWPWALKQSHYLAE